MKKIYVVLAALTMIATACARTKEYPKAPAVAPLPSGEFPIMASTALYPPFITDTQMQWLKDAGFSLMMCSLNVEETDSLLSMVQKHGMTMMANPYGLRDIATAGERARRYAGQPGIWGYGLCDEPDASKFEALRVLRDTVVAASGCENTYMNLLPAVGPQQLGAPDYRTYVEDFVATVNPPYISLDIYPVRKDKEGNIFVEPVLYSTMETIREVAQESERPFWSFILSNKHWMYPAPKEEYIRFQVFTALAYGAQGLSYYTYQMPLFDKQKREYSDAPIDWDGNRTPTWYMVRNVNREVQNLARIFMGAETLSVTQSGESIPPQTVRNYKVPSPFIGLESGKEGVTVSHLRNGNTEYLLLVNRDVEHKQKVRLSRTRPVTRIYGDGHEKPEKGPSVTLSPGGYALYRLSD